MASVSAGSVGITISGASTDGFDTAAAQLEATATVTSTIVESQETPAGVITPVSALVGQGTEGSDSGMASLASTVTILSSLVEGSDASASALQQQLPGRSHSPQRNQQWLVDYYTEAFKKKAVAPTPAVGRKVTRRTSERVAEEQGAALLAKVERAVTRARSDIDRLTAQVTDRAEVQRIDDVLRAAAVNSHKTIVNFMLIELNYRQSESRRDEELMLFALDLLPTGNSTPLSVGDAELSLLAHIL